MFRVNCSFHNGRNRLCCHRACLPRQIRFFNGTGRRHLFYAAARAVCFASHAACRKMYCRRSFDNGSRIFVRVGRQHSARSFRMGLFQHETQPLRANLPPLFLFLGFVDSTRFAVEQVAASSCASLFVIVILQAVSVSEKVKNMVFRENAD